MSCLHAMYATLLFIPYSLSLLSLPPYLHPPLSPVFILSPLSLTHSLTLLFTFPYLSLPPTLSPHLLPKMLGVTTTIKMQRKPTLLPPHACTHVCMYPCMHVPMYACTHVCMYLCMHVPMYACTHVPIILYACTHVCMRPCMRVQVYPCMHVPMYSATTITLMGCFHLPNSCSTSEKPTKVTQTHTMQQPQPQPLWHNISCLLPLEITCHLSLSYLP